MAGSSSVETREKLRERTRASWADPAVRAKRISGIRANPGGLRARMKGLSETQVEVYRLLRRAGVSYKRARKAVVGSGFLAAQE